MASLLVRGGTVVTLNDRFDVIDGDVSIRDGRIDAIGSNIATRHDKVIDARGGFVLPGLIQTLRGARDSRFLPLQPIDENLCPLPRNGCRLQVLPQLAYFG